MADTSGVIVRELLDLGLSRRAIGQAIGRNDRLIGYVEKGVKPGANLRGSLEALRAQVKGAPTPAARRSIARDVTLPEPSRRVTKAGREARVRAPIRRKAAKWGTSTVKRQAVQGGSRALYDDILKAADKGRKVAFTIKRRDGREIRVRGNAREVAREIREVYGGNVTDFAAAACSGGTSSVAAGGNDGGSSEPVETEPEDITGIELREWDE